VTDFGKVIRERRDARLAPVEQLKAELIEHIDAHFAAIHARLDELGKQ
jgi:hypothetical protein